MYRENERGDFEEINKDRASETKSQITHTLTTLDSVRDKIKHLQKFDFPANQ